MFRGKQHKRTVFGRAFTLVGAVAVLAAVGFAASAVAAPDKPEAVKPPTVSGTPEVGQKLTGDKGNWSNNPTDFNFFWVRCDENGGSCANISGANQATYTLTTADRGNTLRFRVEASNAAGSTTASSVPTAVIRAAAAPSPPPAPTPPAPSNGCPAGSEPIQVSSLSPPARLTVDGQQAVPSVVRRGTTDITIRYHVSACGGRSVEGALVYSTAVPFNQLSIPAEQPTGQDGWVALRFHALSGFPVSPRQQLIALFTRARKPGENLLGGISTRRLFSLRVNLH
jgi:hypothetical protein